MSVGYIGKNGYLWYFASWIQFQNNSFTIGDTFVFYLESVSDPAVGVFGIKGNKKKFYTLVPPSAVKKEGMKERQKNKQTNSFPPETGVRKVKRK